MGGAGRIAALPSFGSDSFLFFHFFSFVFVFLPLSLFSLPISFSSRPYLCSLILISDLDLRSDPHCRLLPAASKAVLPVGGQTARCRPIDL